MKISRDSIYFFACLYILLVPVGFYFFPFHEKVSSALFSRLISYTSQHIFKREIVQPTISSDALSMYVLVFVLFVFAVVIAVILNLSTRFKQNTELFLSICKIIFCYYLASQLFIYGFDKVFKAQFYTPEPNILFTPLGSVSRDLLYWSTMGSSYSYNLFLGTMEIIAALLLIFRRTRVAGLIGSFILLLNIVAVNFSFDISVKIHSSFLLFLSLLLSSPYLKSIFNFLIGGKMVQLNTGNQLTLNPALHAGLKTFVLCLIFFEALYPFIKSKNVYDDLAAKPFLHGAYEVYNPSSINDSTVPSIKRFFIHRDGYLIFQNNKDEMQDYKLFVDTITKNFLLIDYARREIKVPYDYQPKDSMLILQYNDHGKKFELKGKGINWRNLPLLKNDFHWAVEDVSK